MDNTFSEESKSKYFMRSDATNSESVRKGSTSDHEKKLDNIEQDSLSSQASAKTQEYVIDVAHANDEYTEEDFGSSDGVKDSNADVSSSKKRIDISDEVSIVSTLNQENMDNTFSEESKSKYFMRSDATNSESVRKGSTSDHEKKLDNIEQDSLSSQASAKTQLHEYTEEDFGSSDGSDGDGVKDSNADVSSSKKRIDISDESTDDESPWQKHETKTKGKYKLRQTTLPFGRKEQEETKPKLKKMSYSDADTEQYRMGYPGKVDDETLEDNLLFYQGRLSSNPEGDYIDNIHQEWFGNHLLLERHHGYIQWLFPIRESGMNWQAQPLQLHEAKAIQEDPTVKERVLVSYQLMLDFYGMELVDPDTGEIERSRNWKKCYDNLNWSSHNYLRITRILKSLGELGYEHLKKPFLKFVLHECLVECKLTRVLRSCRDFWIGTVKNSSDREELYKFIEEYS